MKNWVSALCIVAAVFLGGCADDASEPEAGIAVSAAQTLNLVLEHPETIMGSAGAVAVVTVTSTSVHSEEIRFGLEVPAGIGSQGALERTFTAHTGSTERLDVVLKAELPGEYVFRAWMQVGPVEMFGRTATQIWRGLRVNATGTSEFYAHPQASALEFDLICEIPAHLDMIAALSVDEPIRGTLFFSHHGPLIRGNEREDVDLAAGEMKRWPYKLGDWPQMDGSYYGFTAYFYPDASQDIAVYTSSCFYEAMNGTLHFVGKEEPR